MRLSELVEKLHKGGNMAERPTTRQEALALALDWAEGRRSWMNLGYDAPYTPDVIAVMDVQEVVKWSALADVLPAAESDIPK